MRRVILLLSLACFGCPDPKTQEPDSDGDGFVYSEDCDDSNAAIHPGADELCNLDDDDCDGEQDEADAVDATVYYADLDSDGAGDGANTQSGCTQPPGYVLTADDCNDAAVAQSPYESERCNGIDDDCDGSADEDVGDAPLWYPDSDGDGAGDPAGASVADCDSVAGYVDNDLDCDDLDPNVGPGATESCDDLDSDCDGDLDDPDAVDAPPWYEDVDQDGYGLATGSVVYACVQPRYYAAEIGDCNDTNRSISPAATETCDDVDNNCDGQVDEDGASGSSTWYADSDGDGFGDLLAAEAHCEAPVGFVASSEDCDDTDAAVSPSADEHCDGRDDDCDGTTDEDDAVDSVTWYADHDVDGWGASTRSQVSCEPPAGWVAIDGDCNDGVGAVNPDAVEVCNRRDDDCDGDVDSDAVDPSSWYIDADGDRHGDAASTRSACFADVGEVASNDDCDDSDATVAPGMDELCNGIDDDCDTVVDDAAVDAPRVYPDEDGDGFGVSSLVTASCDVPAGYSSVGFDCDDANATVSPDAEEVCNSVDDDCDGTADEGAVDAVRYFPDVDADGFGVTVLSERLCELLPGYAAVGLDCDDTDPAIAPSASEVCNLVDDDCDGEVDADAEDADWIYPDADGDGYGDPSLGERICELRAGYTNVPGDCDDGASLVSPEGVEVCDNGLDDDCVDGDAPCAD